MTSSWPSGLHADCASARQDLGETDGAAEILAVFDVAAIARLMHPHLTPEKALHHLADHDRQRHHNSPVERHRR